jgi:Bifunctional DNA primase/polymerase, N-terminal
MQQEHDVNRDAALRLAEAGIAVFPCGPDKKPLIKWREFSSSDVDAVVMWWSQHSNALPGIDLEKSDLVVLDGDRHGGPDGRAALRELLRRQSDTAPLPRRAR